MNDVTDYKMVDYMYMYVYYINKKTISYIIVPYITNIEFLEYV